MDFISLSKIEGLQPQSKYQKQNFSCIYKISSKLTNRCYIGSAKHYGVRRRNHLFQLQNNKHHSKILQNHVNKYGIDDLTIEVIEMLVWGFGVVDREQYYIDTINPYFNVLKVAYSTFGRVVSEETRQKLIKSHTGKKLSQNQKEKMSKSMIGRQFSMESLIKMKASWKKRDNIRPVICIDTGIIYESTREAEQLTGCDNIHGICAGLRGRKTSKGLTFKFYKNEL